MPGDPGELVVTNACAFYLCARGYGCNGHPAFPAPFLGVARRPLWAKDSASNSGAMRGGNAEARVMNTDAPQSPPSSPAKAGDPVFRDADVGIEKLRRSSPSPGGVPSRGGSAHIERSEM